MHIDYDEVLEAFSVGATIYNEVGNGTLKQLPQEIYTRIDDAVSRALIVGILVARYDIAEISEEEIDEVVDTLLNKLISNNSH